MRTQPQAVSPTALRSARVRDVASRGDDLRTRYPGKRGVAR